MKFSRSREKTIFNNPQYTQSRLEIPEAGHGKPCNAGRLREAAAHTGYGIISCVSSHLYFEQSKIEGLERVRKTHRTV